MRWTQFLPPLCLAIHVGALAATAGLAQNAPLPAPAPVTADLVDRADTIIRTRVAMLTPTEGGVFFRVSAPVTSREWVTLRGPSEFSFRGVFVPQTANVTLEPKGEYILFLRWDPAAKRNVLIEDKAAVQPSTPERLVEIRELAQRRPRVSVKLTSEKPSYRMGESITVTEQVRNASARPLVLYLGDSAFRGGYSLNEAGRGGGGSYQARTEEHYRTLQPGEVFERKKNIEAQYDTGQLSVRFEYICDDNWIGSHERNVTRRVAETAFCHEETRLEVPIEPPDAAFFESAPGRLTTGTWGEQREVMRLLVGTPQGAAMPQVEAMAAHPWSEIRLLAARGITRAAGPMTPELRDLLYDPAVTVRYQVLEYCRTRGVPDSALPVLALKLVTAEAVARGFLAEGNWARSADYLLTYRYPDKRLGDLFCALMAEGKDDGHALARMLGLEQRVRKRMPWSPTEEEKALIRTTWQEQRGQVAGVWSMEDLQAEMARCRAKAFLDLKLDPRFAEIRRLMKELTGNPAAPAHAEAKRALGEMGPGIVPTTLFILQNTYHDHESWALYQLYRQWRAREALPHLFGRSYDSGTNLTLFAPYEAALIDPEVARPHLEYLYTRSRGAAVALAHLGEARALPFFMPRFGGESTPWTEVEMQALAKATGQQRGPLEWRKWWAEEGSRQEWR